MSENNQPWWIPIKEGSAKIFTPEPMPETASKPSIDKYLIILSLLFGIIGGFGGAVLYNQVTSVHLNSATTVIDRAPNSIAGIAARVSPSVVSVRVNSQFGGDTGSGFFISSNGYLLTNNHVIANAANGGGNITVSLPAGKTYNAKLVGADSSYDLAVIKIPVSGAPVLPLGNSDSVAVGDPVIAVGSPLELAGTVTSGIISAKNRPVSAGEGNGQNSYINALQTDAPINPGNSGGPLIDSAGNVIGINSAIASLDDSGSFGSQSGSIGIGFAIPINQAKEIAKELIKNGFAVHPILGIELDANNPDTAVIANGSNAVAANGPAAKAGLRSGDIITQIDGVTLTSSDQLIVEVRSHQVGDKVKLTINRNGKTLHVWVTLAASQN
jgi:putative serine protease PepD